MQTVLLPGMDGTGALFAPYLAVDPGASPVAYPTDEVLGYDALAERVLRGLPTEPHVLVAESFSGPIAIRVAERRPRGLLGLVLVATFVTNPTPFPALARVPSLVFSRPPPLFLLARWLTGDPLLARRVQEALRSVRPEVLAHRARQILAVDAREALSRCGVPVLVLGGARDRLVPWRAIEQVASLAPVARLSSLDAPHLVLQTRPREACTEIAGFRDALG